MKMTGEQRIAASRQKVWNALNDPVILKECIPGCQSLEKETDERLKATVAIKIGPIGARFNGAVVLSDLDPPNAYVITGEGQGGPAGSAKGSAKVRLSDESGATLLSYEVDAQVGGKMAQLGGAIIDATAKQLAGTFFKRFGEIVAAPTEPPPAQTASASPTVPSESADRPGAEATPASGLAASAPPQSALRGPPWSWLLVVFLAALSGFLLGGVQDGGSSGWAGLSFGMLVIIVAAASFEFGRRTGAPTITLDLALIDRLVRTAQERK